MMAQAETSASPAPPAVEHEATPAPPALEHEATEATEKAWQALRYFNGYRGLLALLLLGLAGLEPLSVAVLRIDAPLLGGMALAYFGFALAFQFAVNGRWASFVLLRTVQVPVDVLAMSLLLEATGGVSGGFGILMVVANAGASLLAGRRAAIAYASLYTLALLVQTGLGILRLGYGVGSSTPAALLGVAFFGTGFLAAWLAEQARRSEALAEARAVALRNLAQLNEIIVQRLGSGLMVLDDRGQVLLANDAARRWLAGAVPAGGDLAALAPALHRSWQHWLEAGNVRAVPVPLASHEASLLPNFQRLGDGSTLVTLEDAAEARRRAQELKLASLGRLTASIAHEIRNPLGAISHAGQLLAESSHLPADDQRLVQIIAEHSARMNEIIRSVLQLGRRDSAVMEAVALVPWLQAFTDELSARYPQRGSLPPVQAGAVGIIVDMDRSQLRQVLWNLAENAERYSRHEPWLRFSVGIIEPGARPFIDVIDTGPGMTQEVADQIFEPFFTSHPEGTGLGLYLARELCEGNRVELRLLAHGASGCAFRLLFPTDRVQGAT